MSLSTLIVDGDALKLALGIEGTDEDDALSQFEAQAVAFVEGETHRRFQAPEDRIEYRIGDGTPTLYVNGHVDDEDGEVVVRERSLRSSEWSDVDADKVARRRDTLVRLDGSVWSRTAEYELTYEDGYDDAPADIQALIIELVGVKRASIATAASVTTGTGAVKSTTIGEFSETYDVGSVVSAANAATSVSAVGSATLKRWRRRMV